MAIVFSNVYLLTQIADASLSKNGCQVGVLVVVSQKFQLPFSFYARQISLYARIGKKNDASG